MDANLGHPSRHDRHAEALAITAPRTDSDWLELGLDLLRTRGPQALTIEELCKAAGRTKGAFYHRFKGTDGYRDALLAHWQVRTTDRVLDRTPTADQEPDAAARRDALNALVMHMDIALERSIRSWGVYDPAVQEAINETDRRRIAAVVALIEPRDTPEETHAAAAGQYATYLGFVMFKDPGTLELMAKWGPRAIVVFRDDLTEGPLPPPAT